MKSGAPFRPVSKFQRTACTVFAIAALSCGATTASAAVVTYSSSIIYHTTEDLYDFKGRLDPAAVSPGDRFNMTFSIDDSILDTDGDPGEASFVNAAVMSLTRDPGNTGSWDPSSVVFNPGRITINPANPSRPVVIEFTLSAGQIEIPYELSGGDGGFIDWSQLQIEFAMTPPTEDTGTGQPLSALLGDISTWNNYQLLVWQEFSDSGFLLDTPSLGPVTAIPEPSTYALTALGLALGSWAVKRRRVSV
jgi:hypothetical protein